MVAQTHEVIVLELPVVKNEILKRQISLINLSLQFCEAEIIDIEEINV